MPFGFGEATSCRMYQKTDWRLGLGESPQVGGGGGEVNRKLKAKIG